MFRLQNHTPPVYINQSRDFQLLCRLMDCLQGATKHDTDTIINIIDVLTAKDIVLPLLCTKVGFFPRINIDANVLKYIVASFSYMLREKGSRQGIIDAVNTIMKAETSTSSSDEIEVEIVGAPDYIIHIYSNVSEYNRKALEEILRYIMPAGYSYEIKPYLSIGTNLITDLSTVDSTIEAESVLNDKLNNIPTVVNNNSLKGTYIATTVGNPPASVSEEGT